MIDEKKLIKEMERWARSNFSALDDKYEYRLEGMIKAQDIILAQPQVGGWIPVTERLPNMEEYLENDGRFILDDGNRRYQGLFDIYDKKFKFSKHLSGLSYELIEDNCVIAWMSLPKPYKESEEK